MPGWAWSLLAALFVGSLAVQLAVKADVVGIDAVDDAARPLGAAVALFAVCGFAPVRLLLPEALRRHELLWVLPVGACALALGMTPLGFAGVPFLVNLVLVLVGAVVLDVLAVRRRGWPAVPKPLGATLWPLYLTLLVALVALIPMFRSGFATVVGNGSDAHMAAGSAELLRHTDPTGIVPELPIDQLWSLWTSKPSIYYALASVAEVAGVPTWAALSAVASLVLGLAVLGFYLLAREALGAGVGLAAVAMGVVGTNQMVLHVGMHPYYNQVWGFVASPLVLLLLWQLLREPDRRTVGLLAIPLIVGAFAYPLAQGFPIVIFLVAWFVRHRRQEKAGEEVVRLRTLPGRGWRWARERPWWAQVLLGLGLLVLLAPARGAYTKVVDGAEVAINWRYDLALWGGDLGGRYFAERRFFSVPWETMWPLAVAIVVGVGAFALPRLGRPFAWGLASVLVVSAIFAASMRLRLHGEYFHFKILAFVAPILLVLFVVGLARVAPRWLAIGVLALALTWGLDSARTETTGTFDQVPKTVLAVDDWGDVVPPGASVRLDMRGNFQLWVAYLLADHPTCSQTPLLNTSYPRVQTSHGADYAIVRIPGGKPFDAVGEPLRRNVEFTLWKLDTGSAVDHCSQRQVNMIGPQ